METAEKFRCLEERLRALGGVLVAYSGGVDSTFLADVAAAVLGPRALAVTACSETYPKWERDEAARIATDRGLRYRLIETSELGIAGFADNPPDRCYFCKTELFSKLAALAREEGLAAVVDGTTADDLSDFRPGRRAAREAGVISPLLETGLTKDEVRALSRARGLPTWDKPSYACLASRFPYRTRITAEALAQVDAAENALRELGLRQVRVRHHGAVARIEAEEADLPRLAGALRDAAVARLRACGYAYVTLDLAGYRTGSMNETLAPEERTRAAEG